MGTGSLDEICTVSLLTLVSPFGKGWQTFRCVLDSAMYNAASRVRVVRTTDTCESDDSLR